MASSTEKSVNYRRVVDLSHPITADIPLWPGDPPVRFGAVADIESQGYFLRQFSMGEHSGTHLATPSACCGDGMDPNQIPADSLVAPAVVIDARDPSRHNPDYALSARDIAAWERKHGPVESGALVLLNTGWAQYWTQPERFIGRDSDGATHTPGFSLEAARFLLEWRQVAGLGIDTHGIDPGADAGLSVSRLALGRAALVLECLNNLDELPPTGSTVVVGRLRLVGGSGSPASALALAP